MSGQRPSLKMMSRLFSAGEGRRPFDKTLIVVVGVYTQLCLLVVGRGDILLVCID